MDYFFQLVPFGVLAIAVSLLVIGLINPSLVVKSKKKDKRVEVWKWYGTIIVFAIILVGIVGVPEKRIEGQLDIPTQVQPVVEATPAVEIESEIESASEVRVSAKEALKVHFIDVGQGDAIYIQYGLFDMLIDAGDNAYGKTVSNYLKEQKVETLEYIVGTHMDADHIGGLDVILEDFQVENIIDSGTKKSTKTYQDYAVAVEKEGATYQEDEEMTIRVDDNLSFKVIETGDNYKDENDNSVVIWLTYLDKDFLFTGDMEAHAEEASLDKFQKVEVLKSGHHGSRTSSSEAFLDITKPEYVVISCGMNNKYKHPHQETIDKYAERGIEVYRTDLSGNIIANVDVEGNISWEMK